MCGAVARKFPHRVAGLKKFPLSSSVGLVFVRFERFGLGRNPRRSVVRILPGVCTVAFCLVGRTPRRPLMVST